MSNSKVVQALTERGPLSAGGMPRKPNYPDKRNGVTSFNPALSNTQQSTGHGGQTQCVYYHMDLHDPEQVIRSWLDENPRTVEYAGRQSVASAVGGAGRSWKEAWKEVAFDYF